MGTAPLTGLRGLPPGLLDVLLRLVAQLDLQLLGLHLQVPLPLRERFTGLGAKDTECCSWGSEPGGTHGHVDGLPVPFFSLSLWMMPSWP